MVSGAAPPAIVTGVLSIPDVMRIAVAAQEVDKVLGARRQKLTDDEQKEQQSLHDLDQQLANDRPKLSAEQVRVRERELQDRLNDSRRRFATRDRIIQDAGQFCLVQIQREMTAVVQLVAAERNMNFIVRREQVVLSTGDVDITAQVLDILNKVLPSVIIPPDGVAVLDLKPVAGSKPADAGQPKH
jgi:Skp family chaperone for outer membrane proteins